MVETKQSLSYLFLFYSSQKGKHLNTRVSLCLRTYDFRIVNIIQIVKLLLLFFYFPRRRHNYIKNQVYIEKNTVQSDKYISKLLHP